jgi:hypothetical protein
MRGSATAALLAAGVLAALPAAAQAGARADYRQVFSTPVPGASTGSDTRILYKHPDDPKAKPIPVRQEVFTFPAGTRFDNSVVPDCKASEAELEAEGPSACPPETRVGGGMGTLMSGFPGAGETPMQVDGFDDGSGLLLLAGSKEPRIRLATHAVRRGRVITVKVPRSPGGPPDGETAIRRVHNVFAPRSVGNRAYTRTPSVCPAAGFWTFDARLTFADGVTEHHVHRMPCMRDLTPPRIRLSGVPRGRCVTRGFRVRVRIVDASPLERARLLLDRHLLRRTPAVRFAQRVRLRGLSAGRHRLTVVARDVSGNRARRSVRFRRCALH